MAADRSQVHLCLTDSRDQTYTLHNVDVAPLFRHSEEPEPEPEPGEALPLPPAALRFQPSPDPLHDNATAINFHLLGGTRVVSIDELRRTLIYDTANGAVRAQKWHTLSASVAGGLYLIDHIVRQERRHCFEALLRVRDLDDWYWHRLPQPPGYTPSRILAHAAAAAAVWTYAQGVGTYSFDTVRRAWRKEGNWALPFRGKAEHVPGPGCGGFWFGISSAEDDDRRLCAVDLATATASSPPEVRGVWEDFRPPRHWSCKNATVVYLGGGKLCTVRFFVHDRPHCRSLANAGHSGCYYRRRGTSGRTPRPPWRRGITGDPDAQA